MTTVISACLAGINCKYNGENNLSSRFEALLQTGQVIPVCPEQLGGFSTPRAASEIVGGTGRDVLEGRARVINRANQDVTDGYIKGAFETLKIAQKCHADLVIFKNRSPSCGAGQIYDGSFTRTVRKGDGITTALLKEHGFCVLSDEDFEEET
jgi:uncharacterized protein YbbK (DUF523 family)